jgi:hypothetical protein
MIDAHRRFAPRRRHTSKLSERGFRRQTAVSGAVAPIPSSKIAPPRRTAEVDSPANSPSLPQSGCAAVDVFDTYSPLRRQLNVDPPNPRPRDAPPYDARHVNGGRKTRRRTSAGARGAAGSHCKRRSRSLSLSPTSERPQCAHGPIRYAMQINPWGFSGHDLTRLVNAQIPPRVSKHQVDGDRYCHSTCHRAQRGRSAQAPPILNCLARRTGLPTPAQAARTVITPR